VRKITIRGRPFFLSLRGTSGERIEERGKPVKTDLISPTLPSL